MNPSSYDNKKHVQPPEQLNTAQTIVPGPSQDVVEDWFAKLIHHLKLKQIQYSTNTLTNEEAGSIEDFATGQFSKAWGRDTSEMIHRNFVAQLLEHYLNEISGLNVKQLGFEWHSKKVLVWAEIEDNDVETEGKFYTAESRTNAAFSEYGFAVDTIVVESQDECVMPPHFTSFAA